MGSTSEAVSFSGFDGSGHSSYSLGNVGVDDLVDLLDVGHKLLDCVSIVGLDLQQNRKTNVDLDIVSGDDSVVGTFVYEVLLGDEVLAVGPRKTPVESSIPVALEGTRSLDDGGGSIRDDDVGFTAGSTWLTYQDGFTTFSVFTEEFMA